MGGKSKIDLLHTKVVLTILANLDYLEQYEKSGLLKNFDKLKNIYRNNMKSFLSKKF